MFKHLLDRILNRVTIFLIQVYRRHLSHRKGYRCAWGVYTGKSTCSTVGLRVFRRAGFFKGLALLRRQFDRCGQAAQALSRERSEALERGRYRRLRPMALRFQGGFVDGDCCDADCLTKGPGLDVFDCWESADRTYRCCDMLPADCWPSKDDRLPRQPGQPGPYPTGKSRLERATEQQEAEQLEDIKAGLKDFLAADWPATRRAEQARKDALKKRIQGGVGHFRQVSLAKKRPDLAD